MSVFKHPGAFVRKLAVGASMAAATMLPLSQAAADTIKIGYMLPYSGTFAQLGEMITDGFNLALKENGGKIGDYDVEIVTLDDESNAGRATRNMQQLVSGENVDVVVGTVHSGVAMAMVRVARQQGTILIIPNAGLDAATRQLCGPNIFRTSFSNWQPGYAMGHAAYERGYRNVVTMAWRYGAGQESVAGFKEAFEELGGTVTREFYVPFPEVEFQAQLTEIASMQPDAVYVFFAGGGAVQFVRDYAAAGLKDRVPLIGAGFITEGTLQAQGEAAEGVLSALHYSEALDTEENQAFRQAFHDEYGKYPDIYAVQGYDAAKLLIEGVNQAGTKSRDDLIHAMRNVELSSPRGPITMSRSHNPIQNMYLREVQNGENVVIGTAYEMLEDPGTGCAMRDVN
ncbi:MAG: ABC transporter substrate-binding protein [Ectothiorhodospiraceae bacterium]|nr:ABC transporter substrate-binding protein [Ectothiorhodospiraceae bacterium]MCH8503749.1 ABC transporter substrate-binding protein [Ectothiorhodospiraceae bacterium]